MCLSWTNKGFIIDVYFMNVCRKVMDTIKMEVTNIVLKTWCCLNHASAVCTSSAKRRRRRRSKKRLLQSTSCKRHLFVHDNAEIMSVLMTVVLKCVMLLNVSCVVSNVCCSLHFSWTTEQDSEEGKGIECLIYFSWEWMVTLQDFCK